MVRLNQLLISSPTELFMMPNQGKKTLKREKIYEGLSVLVQGRNPSHYKV